jgi:hypothetical protein
MTTITVPDAIAPSIERFVKAVVEKGIDKLTFGQYANSELEYVTQELKTLVQRPLKDTSGVAVVDRLRILLKLTGEAFVGPSGLEVSSRVLSWCLNALAKQEGMTTDEARVILDSKPDGDRFWWFMQLLDDAALNALVQILEKERKK